MCSASKIATLTVVEPPKTDVAIELGGEDAKIIYFEGGNVEQRMNGICAGGTGSFIDQMASLIQTDASGLNEYAKNYHINKINIGQWPDRLNIHLSLYDSKFKNATSKD